MCLLQTNAFATFGPHDKRNYVSPPYSYTYFEGGNCVWFAWEMAYQEWNIKLPWVGDAREWIELDERKIKQNNVNYKLKLLDEPMINNIMILQPSDLRSLYGGPFKNDFYGHVAWVVDIEKTKYGTYITVLKSSVYPSKKGERWHGCWRQQYKYKLEDMSDVKFLCIVEIKLNDLKVKGNNINVESLKEEKMYKISLYDKNNVSFHTTDTKSIWTLEKDSNVFLGNTEFNKLAIKNCADKPEMIVQIKEPFDSKEIDLFKTQVLKVWTKSLQVLDMFA